MFGKQTLAKKCIKGEMKTKLKNIIKFELFAYNFFKKIILFYINFLRKFYEKANKKSEKRAQLFPNGSKKQVHHILHEKGQKIFRKLIFYRQEF